nr:MAG TPA: hypothetical protein [Caudoviricetes sp.]
MAARHHRRMIGGETHELELSRMASRRNVPLPHG